MENETVMPKTGPGRGAIKPGPVPAMTHYVVA